LVSFRVLARKTPDGGHLERCNISSILALVAEFSIDIIPTGGRIRCCEKRMKEDLYSKHVFPFVPQAKTFIIRNLNTMSELSKLL